MPPHLARCLLGRGFLQRTCSAAEVPTLVLGSRTPSFSAQCTPLSLQSHSLNTSTDKPAGKGKREGPRGELPEERR